MVATVTANNEEGTLNTFGDGEEDASDEGLGVVGLLEDDHLLAETRTVDVNDRSLCKVELFDDLRARLLVLERGQGHRLDRHGDAGQLKSDKESAVCN